MDQEINPLKEIEAWARSNCKFATPEETAMLFEKYKSYIVPTILNDEFFKTLNIEVAESFNSPLLDTLNIRFDTNRIAFSKKMQQDVMVDFTLSYFFRQPPAWSPQKNNNKGDANATIIYFDDDGNRLTAENPVQHAPLMNFIEAFRSYLRNDLSFGNDGGGGAVQGPPADPSGNAMPQPVEPEYALAWVENNCKFAAQRTPEEMADYYGNRQTLETQQWNQQQRQKWQQVVQAVVGDLNRAGLGKYTEWVLYKTKDKILPEDLGNIMDWLAQYDKLRSVPRPQVPPITAYPDFTSLVNDVGRFTSEDIERQKLMMPEDVMQQHQGQGAQVVMSMPPYQVIKVDSPEAASDLCRHTGWCVKDPTYFAQYNLGPGNPLYLVTKNNQKYMLINFASGQVKDANDSPISENPEMTEEMEPLILQLAKAENIRSVDLDTFESDSGIQTGSGEKVIISFQPAGMGEEDSVFVLQNSTLFGTIASIVYSPEMEPVVMPAAPPPPELQQEMIQHEAYRNQIAEKRLKLRTIERGEGNYVLGKLYQKFEKFINQDKLISLYLMGDYNAIKQAIDDPGFPKDILEPETHQFYVDEFKKEGFDPPDLQAIDLLTKNPAKFDEKISAKLRAWVYSTNAEIASMANQLEQGDAAAAWVQTNCKFSTKSKSDNK